MCCVWIWCKGRASTILSHDNVLPITWSSRRFCPVLLASRCDHLKGEYVWPTLTPQGRSGLQPRLAWKKEEKKWNSLWFSGIVTKIRMHLKFWFDNCSTDRHVHLQKDRRPYFHPLKEHRTWCPWNKASRPINSQELSTSAVPSPPGQTMSPYRNGAANEEVAGWKKILFMLIPELSPNKSLTDIAKTVSAFGVTGRCVSC